MIDLFAFSAPLFLLIIALLFVFIGCAAGAAGGPPSPSARLQVSFPVDATTTGAEIRLESLHRLSGEEISRVNMVRDTSRSMWSVELRNLMEGEWLFRCKFTVGGHTYEDDSCPLELMGGQQATVTFQVESNGGGVSALIAPIVTLFKAECTLHNVFSMINHGVPKWLMH
jgi:hypothetical protein